MTADREALATTIVPTAGRHANANAPDWRDMLDLATELANVDGFVPKALLGRPPAILATLLAGSELGLGPMASLRSIYIIEGKATLSAEAARALVYAAGHRLDIDADDTHATARGRRAGETSWTTVEWTLDRARRARLADKQVWRQYPRAMLVARATAELARQKFADVLAGVDITEVVTEENEQAAEETARPRLARRHRAPAAALDAPEAASTAPTTPPPPVTPITTSEAVVDVSDGEEEASVEAPAEDAPSPSPPAPDDLDNVAPLAGSHLRRLHARTAETFPDADRDALDKLRHSIVVLVTRGRPDGAVASSSALTEGETWSYDALLNYIANGECIVGERLDGVLEFRQNGWCYAVHLDPIQVDTTREAG